jgi:hypothetical protein
MRKTNAKQWFSILFDSLFDEHLTCFLQQRGVDTTDLTPEDMVNLVYNDADMTPYFACYLMSQLVHQEMENIAERFAVLNEDCLSEEFQEGSQLALKKKGYLEVIVDPDLFWLKHKFVKGKVDDSDYRWVFKESYNDNENVPFMYVRVYAGDKHLCSFKVVAFWEENWTNENEIGNIYDKIAESYDASEILSEMLKGNACKN